MRTLLNHGPYSAAATRASISAKSASVRGVTSLIVSRPFRRKRRVYTRAGYASAQDTDTAREAGRPWHAREEWPELKTSHDIR